MVDYIDRHKTEFGVEPICTVLQVAPSTYYAAKTRPPSARQLRDDVIKAAMLLIWEANYSVYGVRKLWKAMLRGGHTIGRDQTARLMRELGIRGVQRGRKVFTTRSDTTANRPPDLVKRNFTADRPNALWVTDLTYVATWSGMVYVCFITDVFSRMIVGWTVATNMRTQTVLDTLEHARFNRGAHFDSLVCHSDAGSQGGINRSSQHLNNGGVGCDRRTGKRWCVRIGVRSRRPGDRPLRGVRTGFVSGLRSLVARRRRTPRLRPGCHPRLRSGGSATLVG